MANSNFTWKLQIYFCLVFATNRFDFVVLRIEPIVDKNLLFLEIFSLANSPSNLRKKYSCNIYSSEDIRIHKLNSIAYHCGE